MNDAWMNVLYAGLVSLGWTLWLAVVLTNVGRLSAGLAAVCRRAPMLDFIVAGASWIPWVVLAVAAEVWAEVPWWSGLLGAVAGQVLGLQLWCWGHEFANREKVRGPRIVGYLNKRVGRFRNHAALWVTALAYPIFWGIRFGEVAIYPWLVWTVRLPRYRQAEWVNVSRTKFDGLVGHDLIWCLYCDWMTGVYSLGAEMLRNVESFWCPIRFYDGKKCANCKVDFPDIDGGWVRADGTMGEVVATMQKHYDGGDHSWFGHPGRKVDLTVEGKARG
jgi:hypothetical protein